MSEQLIAQPSDLEAVRASYDRVADNYVALNLGDVATYPWLRTMLDEFARDVRGRGPVLDVGCGPGGIAHYLAERGVDVSGVDLSPRMIEHARRRCPAIDFCVCSATELKIPDGSLAGILGWWSLFNLPRDVLPGVLAGFGRALRPGGLAVIGMHVGDGDVVRTWAYGDVPVAWTTYLWQPEQLSAVLVAAGLEPVAELRLPPRGQLRAGVVLVARRPS